MNVATRGLILVFVPLFFELAIFAILVPMLEQEEKAAIKEARTRSIVLATDELAIMIVTAGNQLASYAIETQDMETAEHKHRQLLKSIDARRKAIRAMSKGVHDFEELSSSVDSLTERALFEMKELDPSKGKPPFVLAMEIGPRVTRIANQILAETYKLHGRDPSDQSLVAAPSKSSMHGVVNMLWLFICASVILSLALVFFFTNTLVKRMALLQENSERFTKKADLLPPLKGKDELQQLDAAFRSMYDTVKRAGVTRQQFFAMVSHDLRTPLTSLRFLLASLKAGVLGDLSEKGKRRVDAAESDVDRLISLINDLLDSERLDEGALEIVQGPVDIGTIIERSVKSVSSLADSKKISFEFSSENHVVNADSDRIVQVMVNLLSNALKYSPYDSKIVVTASKRDHMVVIEVTDSGPGIPQDKQGELFERFRQVSAGDASTGTGLGLFICKTIINKHGGEIGVDSEFGHGTTFWFSLPIVEST